MNFLPRCAIVIPIYRTTPEPYEVISITNNLSVLQDHDIFLLHPRSLNLQPYLSLEKSTEKEFELLGIADENFADIAAYNRLMMGGKVYDAFADYDYILIAQTDSYTFDDQLGGWMLLDYDYIGAPWFQGFAMPISNQMIGVGNGGFSLRKVSVFQRATELLESQLKEEISIDTTSRLNMIFSQFDPAFDWKQYFTSGSLNEDLYFSFIAPQLFPEEAWTKPLPEEAAWFSFECNSEYLYNNVTDQNLPFGCHGWNKYSVDFWKKHISEIKSGSKLEGVL
ncbi:DUF5672 family protein [Synechococcus elongatus IITB4]|uniref:DUF5672 family protein n=1 Tax=Synechococcus elongatus TaxID=32046 RepID=UPI0030CEBB17